jgi:hypothetical protein
MPKLLCRLRKMFLLRQQRLLVGSNSVENAVRSCTPARIASTLLAQITFATSSHRLIMRKFWTRPKKLTVIQLTLAFCLGFYLSTRVWVSVDINEEAAEVSGKVEEMQIAATGLAS